MDSVSDLMESSIFLSLFSRIIELIPVTNLISLDLGLITNESLKYLAKNLENPHHLDSISFS